MSITDKGIEFLSDWIGTIRGVIGMDIPLASDHYGHITVNSCIKLARAMEKWSLAWMEDMVPWQYTSTLKQIRDAVDIPLLTGEDIYLKEEFIKLIDTGAIDMIHPDLATSGGLIETKKIGDYAHEHGVPMAMHFAGSPVSFMANVHTRGRLGELHRARAPLAGCALVGNAGDDRGRQAARRSRLRAGAQHAWPRGGDRRGGREGAPASGSDYFAPTTEWDKERSWDRLWS